jgi:hypothetical protein
MSMCMGMSSSMGRARADRSNALAAPILACVGIALGGCARLPPTGVPASGEPLAVDVRTEQRSYVGQQKVGEVVNKDAAGRVVGTSEIYEDRLVQYNVTSWQVFQGNDKLDDEDFFRIGGDLQAADSIASMRSSAVTTNRVGWVLFGVGLGVLGAGAVLSQTQKEDLGGGIEESPTYPTYIMTGGIITAIVGGGLAWYGAAVVKREHPINDPRRARRVADKYNAKIGKPAGPQSSAPPGTFQVPAEARE